MFTYEEVTKSGNIPKKSQFISRNLVHNSFRKPVLLWIRSWYGVGECGRGSLPLRRQKERRKREREREREADASFMGIQVDLQNGSIGIKIHNDK